MVNQINVQVSKLEIHAKEVEKNPVRVSVQVVPSVVVEARVIGAGPTGKDGIKGEKGDPFTYEDFTPEQLALIGDGHYTHDQIVSSNLWLVNHNLKKHPSVSIVDSSGRLVSGEITYLSDAQLTISFSAKFSGKAYLN